MLILSSTCQASLGPVKDSMQTQHTLFILHFTFMHLADAFIQSDFKRELYKRAEVTDHNKEVAPNIASSEKHKAYIVKNQISGFSHGLMEEP